MTVDGFYTRNGVVHPIIRHNRRGKLSESSAVDKRGLSDLSDDELLQIWINTHTDEPLRFQDIRDLLRAAGHEILMGQYENASNILQGYLGWEEFWEYYKRQDWIRAMKELDSAIDALDDHPEDSRIFWTIGEGVGEELERRGYQIGQDHNGTGIYKDKTTGLWSNHD